MQIQHPAKPALRLQIMPASDAEALLIRISSVCPVYYSCVCTAHYNGTRRVPNAAENPQPNKHSMARGPGAARRAKLGGHNQGCLCCEAPAPTNRSAWLFNPGAGADDDDDGT